MEMAFHSSLIGEESLQNHGKHGFSTRKSMTKQEVKIMRADGINKSIYID